MLTLLAVSCTNIFAVEFASKNQTSTFIELYTSEGCSSCPPADAWLAEFNSRPDLFSSFIPMAFHVDYWDYIGWKDPFAKQAHSERQRALARARILKSVYTPAFVVNSREWRGWFTLPKRLPVTASDKAPGILRGILEEPQLTVTFSGEQALTLNIAYLGMGLESHVTAGENTRRRLRHDFVVLDNWQEHSSIRANNLTTWSLKTRSIPNKGQKQTAIVIWVTAAGSPNIVQATGTLLSF